MTALGKGTVGVARIPVVFGFVLKGDAEHFGGLFPFRFPVPFAPCLQAAANTVRNPRPEKGLANTVRPK